MGSWKSKQFWSAARTNYDEEWRAASSLERAGFEFWVPQFINPKSKHGARIAAREFLFPGYIFWKIRRGWEIISSLRGIARCFMHDEIPVRIPHRELEVLRSMEDEDGIVRLRPHVRVGDRVRVATEHGSFAGIYQGDGPQARCRVLANLFGQAVSVLVDEQMLRA